MVKHFRLLCLSLVFCAGCLGTGSVTPFYTSSTIAPMPELQGMWYGSEKDENGNDKKSPVEITGQKIHFKQDDGSVISGDMVFFKVDDVLFGDMQIDVLKGDEDKPPHMLFKLVDTKDQLTFIPLDYAWLKAQAVSGKIKISYREEKDQPGILFSATPEEWIAFIKAHKDDSAVFSVKDQFEMKRN